MDSNRAMLWTVAVAASLGLHVLIIVALLGFGALTDPSSPSSPPVPTAKPAAVASDSGTVPNETPPAPPAVAGTVPNETPSADSGTVLSEDKYYVVKSGDNLSKIAKLDDSSLVELAELNGKSIKELSKLMVGQKIKVKNGIK